MKVLVTYYSDTGNTEKLARAIYDSLPVNREIKAVKEPLDTAGFDLIFCGFPIHAHSVPPASAKFIKGLTEGQRIVFFSLTAPAGGGGCRGRPWSTPSASPSSRRSWAISAARGRSPKRSWIC